MKPLDCIEGLSGMNLALGGNASSTRLVVIAASAGALPAIEEILSPLPEDFPAAIAVVQHRSLQEPERLVEILARHTRLRVCHAEQGALLQAGTVYVCPPGLHMSAEHCLRLFDVPKLNFVRPNADLMFESVSRTYGERALGVVLSGCGNDGAVGSVAMALAGGTVLAQDPDTSAFTGMPSAAASTGAVEQMLTPSEISKALSAWGAGQTTLGAGPEETAPADCNASPPSATQVLLVDDHQIVLDGLQVLLDAEQDMQVVAKVGDGAAALRAAARYSPDVVVMDIRMPGLDGIQATRQILASEPRTRILALSCESDGVAARRIVRAGASGYLTKHRAYDELVRAIRTVISGRSYLSQEVARAVASVPMSLPGTPN